jgi:hypothetical protein
MSPPEPTREPPLAVSSPPLPTGEPPKPPDDEGKPPLPETGAVHAPAMQEPLWQFPFVVHFAPAPALAVPLLLLPHARVGRMPSPTAMIAMYRIENLSASRR